MGRGARGIVVAVAVLGLTGCGGAKDYSFSRVSIVATILADGSLGLVEERTFDFRGGPFSFAFFTVDWDRRLIEDFTVTRAGDTAPLPVEVDDGYSFRGTWRFSADDEEVTFRISYLARCAVQAWGDTAHLLWQFVGTGWDRPTRHVDVTLRVPGRAAERHERLLACTPDTLAPDPPTVATRPLGRGDVRAWGHGPLGGEVRIPDPHTVRFAIDDLPASTFVEGSVLLPLESVPLAAQVPAPRRQQVLDEEASLAADANRLRREHLAEEERRRGVRTLGWVLTGGALVAMALLVWISRRRDRVRGVPDHLQEPPDDRHPAELAALWGAASGDGHRPHAYRAQLLHLVRNRTIDIAAVGRVTDPEDLEIRKVTEPRPGLDRRFLEFLFTGGIERVRIGSLTGRGKRAKPLREWFSALERPWRSSTGALRIGAPRREARLVAVAALIAIVVSFVVLFPSGLVGSGFAALGASVAGWIAALVVMRPLPPPELREPVARWRAFRRFLREFSSLPEAPTMAVVIWERFLVYAVALGVADEVERQVRALVPPDDVPSLWKGGPVGVGSLSLAHAFATVPAHVPVVASSSSGSSSSFSSGVGSFSSGGGGGGGFSSGGGGGGGGTGGGAG